MDFTLVKLSEPQGFMIGKLNTLRPSLKMTLPQPFLTRSKQQVESLRYFGEGQHRLPLQN